MANQQHSTSKSSESAIRHKIGVFFRHLFLILWSLTTIFPVLWVFMNAFRSNEQIYGSPLKLPDPVIFYNFPQAIKGVHLQITLPNSLMYSGITVVVVLLLSSMTAFYLSKIAKSNLLYSYLILGIMIPVQAVIIPVFIKVRSMNLINSRFGIILVYIAVNLSISIFIMTGFMKKSIPNDLIEAAVIDGYGPVGVFFNIVLPLSKAGMATIGTFIFLGTWNEFLFALVMLSNPALRTLNLSVFNLRSEFSSDQGLIAAGVVTLIVPAIIMYALFQEQVVKGLTAGAIKG